MLLYVATRIAGIPEVVTDGETGFLVEPGDASALGVALARLCGDSALCVRVGAAARASVRERFGADAYSEAVTSIYEEFLGRLQQPAKRVVSPPQLV